ncbi:MAG TPA: acyltransferase [Kofleriaceae bacterium]|nr:acyltransferase [Kofleriaceae bacterium]
MSSSAPNSSSNLDQLRAIAVIAVMIDHLIPTLQYHDVVVSDLVHALTMHIGHAGVLAFFVHTSLVLMHSLERMAAQNPEGLTARFYLRRAFRIYPLSIFLVLFVLLAGLPDATWRPANEVTPLEIAANLLLVQNLVTGQSVLVPLWSLPYEVEMYVVLPLLFFVARQARGARWIATLLVLSYFGAYVLHKLDGGHMNLAGYVPCFLAGVLCYSLRHRLRAVLPGILWLPFVLLAVSAYAVAQMDSERLIYWLGWLYALLLGLAINLFRDSKLAWLNRASFHVATYSYGLYLLHVPMLYVVFGLWQPRSLAVGLLAFVALSAAAAVAAYHLIEAPMVALGRRLTERARPQAAPSGATAAQPAPEAR